MVSRLSDLLPEALLLFVAAAFVLPSQSAYALIFYLSVLPAVAARLSRERPRLDPALALALALIGFSAATLLWGIDDGHRSLRFAWDSLNTAAFVLAMVLVLRDPAARTRLGSVLVGFGAANAVLSMALAQFGPVHGPRLHGWGASSHPILGADVMAVAYLTALFRALSGGTRKRLHFAAAVIMAAFILLTESRGPLLAATLATLLLCAAGPWRVRALLGLALCAAVWLLLPTAVQHHAEGVLVQRGTSHRIAIWRYTLGIIAQRPVLGHGLADNLHLDVGLKITFPHDLYLSLLFYSGVVGLGLFAALGLVLLWRLWRHRADPEFPWLGALWASLAVAGLTDLGQITKGPGPLWFILWLPVGLTLTYPTRRSPAPS